jgi:hypothetical protein
LGCGGLLWRIAREYSPSLYTDVLLGPSITATLCGRAEMNKDSGYFTDKVVDEEIKMLLGFTSNNNGFWSLLEWHERSSRYNSEHLPTRAGSWSRLPAFGWVEKVVFGQGDFGRQISANTSLKFSPIQQLKAHTHTTAHAVACCSHLSLRWPDLWDRWQASDLIHVV